MADDRRLMDRQRRRTPDHASKPPPTVGLDHGAMLHELGRALRSQLVPDELARRLERRVVRVHLHLRDHGDHIARAPGATQGVLQRLLHHVANPARGPGNEHAERERADQLARELVADQLIADLGAVAVDDADVPPGERELDDRNEAGTRMPELFGDRRVRAVGGERVSAYGNDGGLPGRWHAAGEIYRAWRGASSGAVRPPTAGPPRGSCQTAERSLVPESPISTDDLIRQICLIRAKSSCPCSCSQRFDRGTYRVTRPCSVRRAAYYLIAG